MRFNNQTSAESLHKLKFIPKHTRVTTEAIRMRAFKGKHKNRLHSPRPHKTKLSQSIKPKQASEALARHVTYNKLSELVVYVIHHEIPHSRDRRPWEGSTPIVPQFTTNVNTILKHCQRSNVSLEGNLRRTSLY